jgi:hypothetical protein
MARPSPYPAELRKRAVRMVAEVRSDNDASWGLKGLTCRSAESHAP